VAVEPERRLALRRDADALLIERLKRVFVSVAVGYLILVAAAAGALYALEQRDKTRLHDAAMASCKRVNVLRAQTNENALVIYGALYSSRIRVGEAGATRRAQREGAAPGCQEPDASTSPRCAEHPTDCNQAVDHATRTSRRRRGRSRPADLGAPGLLIHDG
jgi:hypothetical protein